VVGTSKSDAAYEPDRSAYLCNYLGYNLATEFGHLPTTAGFMHVTPSTPVDQMHSVLESVTARQLDERRAQGPAPRS
jgi:pyrrolidone-carboxylate peptidase